MGKADKPEKKNKKQKSFWKDFKAELKKVIWPTRSQVINNTIIVLVIVAVVTVLCFVLDLAFDALNTYGIDKLKTVVQNSVSETVGDEESTDSDVVEESTEEDITDEATIEETDNTEASEELTTD